ncbi:MAG TPA: diheme cytochrome c-553 [Thermoanaerobaculia bacterium]|nr:diheme cytochrome c-553 [Thermoanaerobaculia bacterium]
MTKREKLTTTIAAMIAAVAVIAAANTSKPAQAYPMTPKAMTKAEQVARGKYLVTIGGCNDCHTPWIMQANGKPGPDMSRALSGHPQDFPITVPAKHTSDRFAVSIAPTNTAYSGPWGVSFAANLTPDEMTGTGIWTFDIFKNTIRNGRHWGVGRPLNPPMPWFNYREMTDEDLAAVFAYTRTLKPIRNEVPQPLPPAEVGG